MSQFLMISGTIQVWNFMTTSLYFHFKRSHFAPCYLIPVFWAQLCNLALMFGQHFNKQNCSHWTFALIMVSNIHVITISPLDNPNICHKHLSRPLQKTCSLSMRCYAIFRLFIQRLFILHSLKSSKMANWLESSTTLSLA